MPTLAEFIQTPEAFLLQNVLSDEPALMDSFIEYLTTPQDPLLSNERECYLYPSKIAEVLSVGMSYRLLVEKKQTEKGTTYPHLFKLFTQISRQHAEPTLLGYCSKVLNSLVKKTPEIYQFIKDNQQLMSDILCDDIKLQSLKDFISLFLIESTMDLYSFLKSMVIRALILKIVEAEHPSDCVFKCISYFYTNITKALDVSPEDERPELLEVSRILQEEHFITLMILKLDGERGERSCAIGQFLLHVCQRSGEGAEVVGLHIDSILDYLQDYEQSSSFMEVLRKDHLSILNLFVQLQKLGKLTSELTSHLIKRLLVYSNVHAANSFVHNLLFKAIEHCKEQGKDQLLNELNIVQFFIKNQTDQRCGFMSLRRRVFQYWITHHLDAALSQDESSIVRKEYKERQDRIEQSRYYRQAQLEAKSQNESFVLQSASLATDDAQTR